MLTTRPRITIVGGGLAGLAAAVALSDFDVRVRLFERRRLLGGRAGSFHDAASGQWIDHCQHVNLGCCVNYSDFCRRAGTDHLFQRHPVLQFRGPDRQHCELKAVRLPAPLHLAPAMLGLRFLTWRERLSAMAALGRLARSSSRIPSNASFKDWLRRQGQSENAMRRFWQTVIVSALSEDIGLVSLDAARKVFVDGFMAHPAGHVVETPAVPLQRLYETIALRLSERGVNIRTSTPVANIVWNGSRVAGVRLKSEEIIETDMTILAIPWHRLPNVLSDKLFDAIPHGRAICDLPSAPISALHLWFDRPASPLDRVVLIERLSQWVFCRPDSAARFDAGQYCQVVISASRHLAGRPREEILEEVLGDLRSIWPGANEARLLRWRLVTQRDAVLSPRPEVGRLRPPQRTAIPDLFLAGDWTRTGWPSTMEGAVRSGYLAAERLLESIGVRASIVRPEPRTWLTGKMFRLGSGSGDRDP